MKEFNLSEKINEWIEDQDIDGRGICFSFYDCDAIDLINIHKEFIKRVEVKARKMETINAENFIFILREEVGFVEDGE